VAGSVNPLEAIKQRELDIRRRLEEARRQAETRIQAAREQAANTLLQADQEGQAEAEALYQQGIEEAQQQADAIVTAAKEQAAAMRSQALINLGDAAVQIMELVLPKA